MAKRTIHQAVMLVKDADGSYRKPVNAVAMQSVQEQAALLAAAGLAEQEKLQIKAAQTAAAIPESYAQLDAMAKQTRDGLDANLMVVQMTGAQDTVSGFTQNTGIFGKSAGVPDSQIKWGVRTARIPIFSRTRYKPFLPNVTVIKAECRGYQVRISLLLRQGEEYTQISMADFALDANYIYVDPYRFNKYDVYFGVTFTRANLDNRDPLTQAETDAIWRGFRLYFGPATAQESHNPLAQLAERVQFDDTVQENYGFPSSMTFIGDELYFFPATGHDGVDKTTGAQLPASVGTVFAVSGNKSLLKQRNFTSNIGHNNCVDYCAGNDCLISASGANSESRIPQKIYLFPNAAGAAAFDINAADTVTLDLRHLGWGKQTNAIWAWDNRGRHDLIFVFTNVQKNYMQYYLAGNDDSQAAPEDRGDLTGESGRFIRLVQLGMGTDRYPLGTYNGAASGFNGTFRIIKKWQREFVWGDANNDAQFWGGKIYESVVDSTLGTAFNVVEVSLREDSVRVQRMAIPGILPDSQTARETQGMAIRSGEMWMGLYRRLFCYDF